MAAEHTPSPWEIRESKEGEGVCIYAGKYGIGKVWNLNGNPENEANASLIAAAPDMLAALRPFLPAYLAYVETMRSHVGSGETEAERRFSKGECRDAALENAFEELTKVTFDQLAAVAAAIAKATASTRRDARFCGRGGGCLTFP